MNAKRKAYHSAYQQRFRDTHRAKGLCIRCLRPAAPKRTRCRRHLRIANEWWRKHKGEYELQRQLRRGWGPWHPGGPGRPPVNRLSGLEILRALFGGGL